MTGRERVRIRDFCESRLGKMLDRKRETGTRSRPYLRNVSVRWGHFDLSNLPEMDFDDAERQELRLRPGDVLVCEGGEVGRAAVWQGELEECYFQKALHRLRPDPTRCLPEFLQRMLELLARTGGLDEYTSHSTIAYLTGVKLGSIAIPLPPLDQQRRIVDILDRAAGIGILRRQAQETARQIIPALFNKMFGDPGANPQGWPVRPLGEVVAGFAGGRNLQADAEIGARGALRILKVSAVTSGRFRPGEAKPAPPGYLPPAHHFVRDGDLLISRANTAELVGATALVRNPPPTLLLPDKIWRIVWREPSPVTPDFLLAWFKQPAIRAAMSRLASGTSASMRNISQGRLSTVNVILPPMGAQHRFAEHSASLERLTGDQDASRGIEDMLTTSLQTRLLG